jgi:hypothetical protein
MACPGIAAFREGIPIRILHLALPLLLGCAVPTTGMGPEPSPDSGLPLGRSEHLRSGSFTYRLGDLERDGDRLRVSIRLSNGTHRRYSNVMLRVILYGHEGEIRAVQLPAGAILAEQSKPLVARFDDVTFPVEDVTLELIYALP